MDFITSTGSNYLVTPTAYQSWVCSGNCTAYTTTATTTSTSTWQPWIANSSNYTTSLVFNNGYQQVSAEQWGEQQRTPREVQRQTEEQLLEQQRVGAERQRQAEEEAKKRQEEKKRAEVKAKALLLSLLDAEQEKQYQEKGYFELRTDKRSYRIKPGNRVEELDPAGKVVARFCIHPPDYEMPREDWAIAQKLMLEADEETFHRVANRTAA